jgi:hypothetical protein
MINLTATSHANFFRALTLKSFFFLPLTKSRNVTGCHYKKNNHSNVEEEIGQELLFDQLVNPNNE